MIHLFGKKKEKNPLREMSTKQFETVHCPVNDPAMPFANYLCIFKYQRTQTRTKNAD